MKVCNSELECIQFPLLEVSNEKCNGCISYVDNGVNTVLDAKPPHIFNREITVDITGERKFEFNSKPILFSQLKEVRDEIETKINRCNICNKPLKPFEIKKETCNDCDK